MKKITLLLVIIFTSLFSNTSWGEWKLGSILKKSGWKLYYDKDRIRKSGKFLYVWELTNYLKPFKGDLSHISYVELDCSILRYKVLKFQSYDKSMGEGNIGYDVTPKDSWRYPKPNSSVEILYNKVCEEHQ